MQRRKSVPESVCGYTVAIIIAVDNAADSENLISADYLIYGKRSQDNEYNCP